ncbi:hypothetical protein ACFSCW_03310 [Sphingomonas tabacisoli]|uniref:Uncharacterized protein n=1 Tax=Sphingomonas tabacisoli TaxID=2249466 RepID=A0ABW4HYY1_9SPHN
MSLRDLAAQRLARIDETRAETPLKQMKQADACFTDAASCFSLVKHGKPQKTAISEPCFTVSLPRGETHETSPAEARVLRQWRAGLASLSPYDPRAGIAPDRWNALVNDAAALFNAWALQALRLGWTERDLFGVHPSLRPHHQVLNGLAWRCDGFRVIALTEHSASLEGKASRTPSRYFQGDASALVPLWALQ